jgi:hypothetical protein
MRTYGRIKNEDGSQTWVEVDTDANGYNDAVYLTTLCQCLLLIRGESPFYSNFGIPSEQAILQQLFPDYYVMLTQQQFAQYFSSLIISKVASPEPQYNVNVITHQGSILTAEAVPQ